MTSKQSKDKVAIVGCGLIGRSWAMVFASAGYKVAVFDVAEDVGKNALKKIGEQLKKLEKAGHLRGKLSAKSQLSLIKATSSLNDCVNGAFFIQESVPELLDVKRQVLSEIDLIMNEDAILSSSTSALLPSKLSEQLRHKNRFIVSHPANPPYFIPLVELVPASWTDPDVVSGTKTVMTEIGQSPITCKKEQIGFATCRIQYAIINECWRLVKDGYLNVDEVDRVVTEGLGRRYAFIGPLETGHLNAEGMESYFERYGNTIYNTSTDLGPPPQLEGPVAETITQELSKLIPPEKIEARCNWRDENLAALAQLRNKLQI